MGYFIDCRVKACTDDLEYTNTIGRCTYPRPPTNGELYEGLSDARFPLVLVYFKVWPKTSLVPELGEVWALVDKSYLGRTDLLPLTSNHHKTCYFPGSP
jgi:hypothetical protein